MISITFSAEHGVSLAGDDGVPFRVQPTWPNGEPWADEAEALEWAQAVIEQIENPESEFIAGFSREEPRIPKPVSEVIEPEIIDAEIVEETNA